MKNLPDLMDEEFNNNVEQAGNTHALAEKILRSESLQREWRAEGDQAGEQEIISATTLAGTHTTYVTSSKGTQEYGRSIPNSTPFREYAGESSQLTGEQLLDAPDLLNMSNIGGNSVVRLEPPASQTTIAASLPVVRHSETDNPVVAADGTNLFETSSQFVALEGDDSHIYRRVPSNTIMDKYTELLQKGTQVSKFLTQGASYANLINKIIKLQVKFERQSQQESSLEEGLKTLKLLDDKLQKGEPGDTSLIRVKQTFQIQLDEVNAEIRKAVTRHWCA